MLSNAVAAAAIHTAFFALRFPATQAGERVDKVKKELDQSTNYLGAHPMRRWLFSFFMFLALQACSPAPLQAYLCIVGI